jgi:hypothetical protein
MTTTYTNPRFHKGARDTRGGSESAYREFSNALAKGSNDKAYRTLGVRQHDAGATDSERRQDNARYNRGGRNADVAPGQAAEIKTRAQTGPKNIRGAGAQTALGGPKLRAVGAGAIPAVAGRSGGSVGIDAAKSLKAGA